jgi:2-dehydro-3-deoxyglucarate aldolase/4-hydroxy-2-oxoheptanedioate aldolase
VKTNSVKRTLAEGDAAFGAMTYEFSTAGIPRTVAAARAEFILFDQEHTGWSLETLRPLISGARAFGVVPLVRVPTLAYEHVAGALDAGALGVMVPMVENEHQARAIVEYAMYPPRGRRGFGLLYGDEYDDDVGATVERLNRELLLIAQIETSAGLENAERIAAVDGIDVLWLGHYDLSISLDIPGQFEDAKFARAVETLLSAAHASNKTAGIAVASADEGVAQRSLGFRAIAISDLPVFEQGLRQSIETLRAAEPDR